MAAHGAAHRGHDQAAPGVLGREERFEDACERLFAHADAVVDHVDEHIAPSGNVRAERHLLQHRLVEQLFAGLHRHDAVVIHRFGGVDDQVQYDLPDMRRIGLDERQRSRTVVDQRAVARDRGAQQIHHLLHQRIELDVFGDDAAAARVGEHLRHQIRGALRAEDDGIGRLALVGIRCREDRQQVGVAENAGQQVVEIVRDAAGEHHQALALLLFLHAAIERVAFGLVAAAARDVVNDDQPAGEAAFGVADRGHLHFEVARAGLDFHDRGLAAGHRPFIVDRFRPPRHDLVDRTSEAGLIAAGVFLGGRVEIDDPALRVEHDHAIVHILDDHVTRDRHEPEQAIAINAPREAPARHGERDWREVEAVHRQEAAEIQEVADPRHQRADDYQCGLTAIRWREAPQSAHECRGADQDEEVTVGGVDPVPRSAAVDQARSGRRGDRRDRRPVELVLFVRGREQQRRDRHGPHEQPQHLLAGPRHPAVLGREQQPQHADRRDAEVLELRNDDAGLVVVDERVHRARRAPQRDGHHHPAEGCAAGHAAARAGNHCGPNRQAGGGKQCCRLHADRQEH